MKKNLILAILLITAGTTNESNAAPLNYHVCHGDGVSLTGGASATINELYNLFKHSDVGCFNLIMTGIKNGKFKGDDRVDLIKYTDDNFVRASYSASVNYHATGSIFSFNAKTNSYNKSKTNFSFKGKYNWL